MSGVRLLGVAGLIALAACDGEPAAPSPSGDTIPPAIVAISPDPGASDVATTAEISVTFSEPVNPATVAAASFVVRQGFTRLDGSYVVEGVTASFVPSPPLAPATSYSVSVTRAIRDSAGNQLATDTAWAFVTSPIGEPLRFAAGGFRQPTTLRSTNHTFAGRSASRRMYQRNQAAP
jgi:hypothetical protein